MLAYGENVTRRRGLRTWLLTVGLTVTTAACGGDAVSEPANTDGTVTTTDVEMPATTSRGSATDLAAYCELMDEVSGERPSSYVGSAQHLADVERVASAAPAAVGDPIETYRAFLASGAVDPSASETQQTENWPAEIQDAIGSIQGFNADNC